MRGPLPYESKSKGKVNCPTSAKGRQIWGTRLRGRRRRSHTRQQRADVGHLSSSQS